MMMGEFCLFLTIEITKRMCSLELDDDHPYEDKVKFVQHFLQTNYHEELDEEVCQNLGTSILAYDSVPTAIYCFLRALKNDIETVKVRFDVKIVLLSLL